MDRKVGWFAITASMLALAACSTPTQVSEGPATDGFLPNTEALLPGGVGEPALFSTYPSVVWYSYTKMILEPATLWSGSYGGLATVPPTERKTLANAVFSEMQFVSEQLCEMVDTPSVGTLIVNVALVEADTPDPALNAISSTKPGLRLADTIGTTPFDPAAGTFVGHAMLKTIARDATTGAVLWQTIDRRPTDATRGAPLASWREVDLALKSWGAKFGNWLSLVGACS